LCNHGLNIALEGFVIIITTVSIDLAKNVFAVHYVDQNGKTVLVKPRIITGQDCFGSMAMNPV